MKRQQRAAEMASLGKMVSDATVLMHEAIARSIGLAGVDHKYLSIIVQNGPLTAGELSNLTGLTTGAVTGLIDRLEQKKLVKREFDASDRRKVHVAANTKAVKKLLENAHLDLKERIGALITKFSDAEVEAIIRYLTSATRIMNDITKKLNER